MEHYFKLTSCDQNFMWNQFNQFISSKVCLDERLRPQWKLQAVFQAQHSFLERAIVFIFIQCCLYSFVYWCLLQLHVKHVLSSSIQSHWLMFSWNWELVCILFIILLSTTFNWMNQCYQILRITYSKPVCDTKMVYRLKK